MLIKCGNIDLSNRLLLYKRKIGFPEGKLIGNAPSAQIDLEFINEDGYITNALLQNTFEITEGSIKNGVFFVLEKPQKYTKVLKLQLFDNMSKTDIPYKSVLDYMNGTTIRSQLTEMAALSGVTIQSEDLPSVVLNKTVGWIDTTYSIRNYLGWIAELAGMNAMCDNAGKIRFYNISVSSDYSVSNLSDYSTEELWKLGRVCYDDGLTVYSYPQDSLYNTLYISARNLYFSNNSEVEFIYNKYSTLSVMIADNIRMPGIDGVRLGQIVNFNNEFSFIVMDLLSAYTGGSYCDHDISGNLESKASAETIVRYDDGIRIKKVQTTVDQINNTLSIVAQDVADNTSAISQLIIDTEGISTNVETIETTVSTSLKIISYKYGYGTSDSIQPAESAFIYENMPAREDGKYIWRKTTTILNDDTSSSKYEMIQGADGKNGEDGKAGQDATQYYTYIRYSANANGSSMTEYPQSNTKYIGVYTGTSASVPAYTAFTWSKYVGEDGAQGAQGPQGEQGVQGETGATGNGISSIAYYYKATSTQSRPSASSVTSTTIPTLDGTTNKYLWQKEVINYTSGSPKTTVALIGVYGDKGSQGEQGPQGNPGTNGTSVTVSKTEYQAGTSNTTAPTGSWSTSIPSVAQGQYLWTKVTYSDNKIAYSVARQGSDGRQGPQGPQGNPGANGSSITVRSVAYAYQLSTSGTTVPTGTWQTTPQAPTTTQYAWTRTTITFSDNSTAVTYTVGGKTGRTGDTGPQGPKGEGFEFIVGTQNATTNSWIGTSSNITVLYDGLQIAYWLPYAGNGNNVTLNLTLAGGTTTGAIACYYSGTTRITTHYAAGNVVHLTYRIDANVNGTNYTGWWADANYADGNTYDRTRYINVIKAVSAITAGQIIVGNQNGYFPAVSGAVFNIAYPILFAASAISAAGTNNNTYLNYPSVSLRTTKSGVTLTQYAIAYLVGTLNDIKDDENKVISKGVDFTIDSVVFGNAPTTEDGKYYIPIGNLYSTYQVYFMGGVPTLYAYKNGAMVVYPSDDVATVTINTAHNSASITNLNNQISLKADSSTVTDNYNYLNGKITSIEETTSKQSSRLDVMSTQIASKVSSSEVQTSIDNATGQIKKDVATLQRTALTQDSETITRLVSQVNTLENKAEGLAVKVKSDGTYIYKGVADSSGNVTLDENNYTKIDTIGSHTVANNKEVTWNTTDGTGTPKLSIGASSDDAQRWVFSMDGDLLNIRWIDS